MEQERLDSLTRLIASRSEGPEQIRAIQTILKAERLYTGRIDADIGMGTAAGLMAVFRQHPAMLNNIAPWLVRSMEENGFGKQLRDLVAANPALRSQLVESALELVDKSPKAHTGQQAKLSLLNLYNYEGGIDGVKGREHIQAIRDLRALPPAPCMPEKNGTAGIVIHDPRSFPDRRSFSDIVNAGTAGGARDPLISQLAAILERTENSRLHDYFGGLIRDGGGNPVITGTEPKDTADTRRAAARFLSGSHSEQGLEILRLLRVESNGNYNIFAGEKQTDIAKRRDMREMTLDEVLEEQQKRIRAGKHSAAGYFQVKRSTLLEVKSDLGLTGDELFNEDLQKKVGLALLVRRDYIRYLESDGSPKEERRAMRALSNEWAALPNPVTGRSTYDDVGTNRALVNTGPVLRALRAERESYQAYIRSPEATVTTAQQKDFEDLMDVADTIRKPKTKPALDAHSNAEDILAPTRMLAMNEVFAIAHGNPPAPAVITTAQQRTYGMGMAA